MIDNDGAAVECFLKQRAHKRRCYSWGAFVPPAHQWNQTSMPLFGREMEQKGGRHRWRVVGGGLAGLAAPAKQRIRCDGKVSSFHTRTHTHLRQQRDRSLIQALQVHRVFVAPLHQHPMITKMCTHQTDNQSGVQSKHKISRERKTDRQRNDVLLMPPVAAEQLTFISVIFICWQGRKMQAILLSGSSCHFCYTTHLYFICSWCFPLVLDLESFIHPSI